MASSQQTSAPGPIRLVRTHHTEDGSSVFAEDTKLDTFHPFGPQGSGFVVFDARAAVPVNNSDAIPSFANTLPRCAPGGAVFCITDIMPGGQAPMHRTQSIDYAIVISGEMVLRLDSGEEKTVRAGEVIVQQGVNHQWINKSQGVCRCAAVMLSAEKIQLKNGTVLEETVFKR